MISSISIQDLKFQKSIQNDYSSDEQALVTACAKKERRAQKHLYETYYSRLLGVCMRYLPDQNTAEDILHDSFIGIFKNISKFKGNSSLFTWLTRIVINDSLSYLRKKKRSKLEFRDEMEYTEVEELSENEISPYSCEQLLNLMKLLPEGYRTILCMYSIDGLTHKEISDYLNISESSSRSQLSRARTSFRDILKRKEEHDAA